ncbi:MAG: hypothetical protein JWR42_2098 [Marmoricola sp.]|nr:hypothetical protein [Marmoricola sp.]
MEKKPGDDDGQVSEADGSGPKGAGEEIQPDQSVAGAPDDDGVQEGRQGPNARTGESDHHSNDDYVKPGEHRDPDVDRDLDN